MWHFIEKEPVNTKRQNNVDLLKTYCIVCMVFCHTIIRLAMHRSGHENELGYYIGDSLLGCVIAGAYMFVFAMGIGFVFSRKNTPMKLFKRGIILYIAGYIHNFFRYGIYACLDIVMKKSYDPDLWHAFLWLDIFQFAGLAMILTALLLKLKFSEVGIFAVGCAMSIAEGFIPDIQTGNRVIDLILGNFVTASQVPSHFTLFNWYIFAGAGMVFGQIIRRVQNEKRFYKGLLIISFLISAVFAGASFKFGFMFLNVYHRFYSVSFPEALGYLAISLFVLSLFYFITEHLGKKALELILSLSKNLPQIFIIHWCIICFVEYITWYLLQITLSYPVIYTIALVILIVTYRASLQVNKLLKKYS